MLSWKRHKWELEYANRMLWMSIECRCTKRVGNINFIEHILLLEVFLLSETVYFLLLSGMGMLDITLSVSPQYGVVCLIMPIIV